MLFRILPAFLALLAILVLTADARPARGTLQSRRLTPEERSLTNSERLARGLPPRAPGLRRVIPGREATRVYARGPSASPSPSSSAGTAFSGRIQIKSNNTSIGFLNNTATVVGSVDVNGTSGTDIEVKLAITSASSPVSIIATNPLWQGPPFIGGGSNATLSSNSSAAVNITDVPQTKTGARPTASGASAIWLFDKQTQELTAQWINADGSIPNVTLAYDSTNNFVFLTGNLTAYNAAFNATAEAVEFFLAK